MRGLLGGFSVFAIMLCGSSCLADAGDGSVPRQPRQWILTCNAERIYAPEACVTDGGPEVFKIRLLIDWVLLQKLQRDNYDTTPSDAERRQFTQTLRDFGYMRSLLAAVDPAIELRCAHSASCADFAWEEADLRRKPEYIPIGNAFRATECLDRETYSHPVKALECGNEAYHILHPAHAAYEIVEKASEHEDPPWAKEAEGMTDEDEFIELLKLLPRFEVP